VRRIAVAGHRIGNHSDRHREYPKLADAEIRTDLARAESAIRVAAGVVAKPLFRFPFGARTAADIRVVNGAGYVPVRWTVDTLGWKGTSGGITASAVVQRVLDTARPGQIVLMHLGANPDDGSTLDADALRSVIAGLRADGYGFVTLDALLR
jgi:peptidoglycan/xylan/chitin deacetylase (PgdA/CDA1 family)